MCLSTVTDGKEHPKKEGVGWKVFRTTDDPKKFRPQYYLRPENESYIEGREYHARGQKVQVVANDAHKYPPGFHVFATLEAAKAWLHSYNEYQIKKVAWRHQLARGTHDVGDSRKHVIVVKHTTIIPNKPEIILEQ